MAEEPLFILDWTPTVKAWEKAYRARRRATRALWSDVVIGAIFVVLGLGWGWDGVAMVVLGILLATGFWARWYRRLFHWRDNRVLTPTRQLVYDDEHVEITGEYMTQAIGFPYWKALLRLPDFVLLMTSVKGSTSSVLLHRSALEQPERWDELVAFLSERVPPHPHDPGRKRTAATISG